MADPFTGEIRIFPFAFAPYNWAFCNGQPIQVSQNPALYAVIGTQYGGNTQAFNLPTFQGSVPMHQGAGPGLTPRAVGQATGTLSVVLNSNQMPAHTHSLISYTAASNPLSTPTTDTYIGRASTGNAWSDQTPNTTLAPQMMQITGANGAHENRQPYLALNFCICLYGDFPPKPN